MNKQQLAAKIWAAANQMRSKIEASEYKDYILGFIFYKFLSDQELRFLKESHFDENTLPRVTEEEPGILEFVRGKLGYFIAYDDLYSTWLAKGAHFGVADVQDALSAFSRLVSPTHKNVFDKIFDTLQTGLSKLGDTSGAQTKAINALLQLIRDIPTDNKQGYDVLGYIYEDLISKFAATAGKKAGEFYTPHEVSMLIAQLVAYNLQGRSEVKVYDPTSGSGSLLITIGEAIAQLRGNKNSIRYYAQELKENTYNLTRMNLVMHDILPDNIVSRCGDTLEDDWPWFEEGHPETYEPLFVDAVVSNPPYSQHWEPEHKDSDERFRRYGVAPKSKADYAFLLHDLYHLQNSGVMCIVLPHGVLFRGGQEGHIRKALVEYQNIDAIIGLPANIFFGTGIPTIVMVLKKRRSTDDILIIDASRGFVKEGKNNKLRASDIRRIVDAYKARQDIESFCRVVSKEEVRQNDYNLNIPRYIDSAEPTESQDMYATMFGGIPTSELEALKPYWEALPGLYEELFEPVNAASAKLKVDDLDAAVRKSTSVTNYLATYDERFEDLSAWLYEALIDEVETVYRPTEKDRVADVLFERLDGVALIDRYDAYQILDDKWQIIDADLETIQAEHFETIKRVDPNMALKKKQGRDIEVQQGWRGRILPFSLVQKELLKENLDALEQRRSRMTAIDSELEEMLENLSEEDIAALGEALNEAGDAFVAPKLKGSAQELREDADTVALAEMLDDARNLLDEQKSLKKQIKEGEAALIETTKETIEGLSDDQARALLDIKWNQPIVEQLHALPRASIDTLISKVKALRDKYATTLLEVDEQIRTEEAELSHLLGQLVGSEFDLAGIAELRSLLDGDL